MLTPQEERDLLLRAQAGENLALDRLLLAHSRALAARVEGKIPDTLRAVVATEDILQDTFTEAYRGIAAFRPEGPDSFFRWLSTIAEHRVLDAVRAHKAAKRGGGRAPVTAGGDAAGSAVIALLDLVAVHERTPSRSAAGHEAVAAIRSAIADLKPDYREAITLRYIEGLPVAEAAARMKRTERAIHKLCSRGIDSLRDTLGDPSRFFSQG